MRKITNIAIACLMMASCSKQSPVIPSNTDYAAENGRIITTSFVSNGKKFLFDAKHAQTAGNADWVIDQDNNIPQKTPTPTQTNITSTTGQSYWTGGISAWGVALVKSGSFVETLPASGSLTYGSTTNLQDLSRYDVFVIDEPNTRFTAAEKTAILSFVKNGGGLFMISNHNGSDRNNDGWDSPAIWNDLMNNNTVQTNPFGLKIDLVNISTISSNVTTIINPITNGIQGNVTSLEFNSGSTLTISNSTATGLIWRNGFSRASTNVMAAYATFGLGRVFVITDSSPADDGTGAPNNTLYPGWTSQNGNHSRLHMNACLWLAKLQ